jgi:hypothetical protein
MLRADCRAAVVGSNRTEDPARLGNSTTVNNNPLPLSRPRSNVQCPCVLVVFLCVLTIILEEGNTVLILV